ncbi:hypothetical protein V6N13_149192 [Hibiscus sabdariffa]|uniref:TF-B3 domain-containing protein n=1 Tax=Hibiscus sabdariffa TaxID=183260 RepID=A0ABR2ELT5_9ROSI
MEVIDLVYLAANNAAGWLFRDHTRTLPAAPGGRIVLTVSDGSESWQFECKSLGDNMYYMTGREWTRFLVGTRIHDRVTLYSKQDGENFHRLEVVRRD